MRERGSKRPKGCETSHTFAWKVFVLHDTECRLRTCPRPYCMSNHFGFPVLQRPRLLLVVHVSHSAHLKMACLWVEGLDCFRVAPSLSQRSANPDRTSLGFYSANSGPARDSQLEEVQAGTPCLLAESLEGPRVEGSKKALKSVSGSDFVQAEPEV